jgi:hypothetical protein
MCQHSIHLTLLHAWIWLLVSFIVPAVGDHVCCPHVMVQVPLLLWVAAVMTIYGTSYSNLQGLQEPLASLVRATGLLGACTVWLAPLS